jgi:ABC-type glycerol-3-phosphate transport system permease component
MRIVGVFKNYFILIIVSIFLMIPVFLLVTSSLKTFDEVFTYPPRILPEAPQWQNYIAVFRYTDFGETAMRTGLLAITFAGITTITSSLSGYAFARYHVPGSRILFIIVISMLIVPQIVVIIPQFIIYARLHLINTYWPWILSALSGTPLYIFLFRQFFMKFPKELEDAAEVDGCDPLRLFVYIFLPNSKPVIATVMIFAFISVWGDYFTPLIFLNPDKTLLGVALTRFGRNPAFQSSATIMYILPLVVVFFFAQKHILKGVVTTGLKG